MSDQSAEPVAAERLALFGGQVDPRRSSGGEDLAGRRPDRRSGLGLAALAGARPAGDHQRFAGFRSPVDRCRQPTEHRRRHIVAGEQAGQTAGAVERRPHEAHVERTVFEQAVVWDPRPDSHPRLARRGRQDPQAVALGSVWSADEALGELVDRSIGGDVEGVGGRPGGGVRDRWWDLDLHGAATSDGNGRVTVEEASLATVDSDRHWTLERRGSMERDLDGADAQGACRDAAGVPTVDRVRRSTEAPLDDDLDVAHQSTAARSR